MVMYAVIRIKGTVGISKEIRDTLQMLNLKRPNYCTIIPKTPQYEGMLKKVKDYVAYGEIDRELFKKMLKKWGRVGRKRLDESFDIEKITQEIFENNKKLRDFGINSYFRLHPPRKGHKSTKKHYPKGSLGYHGEDINKLLERMI